MKAKTEKSKEKSFDSVKMMREIRDSLSKRWYKHPELLKQDLNETKKEYKKYFK